MSEYLFESVWQTINMKSNDVDAKVTALMNERLAEGWRVGGITRSSAPSVVSVLFERD